MTTKSKKYLISGSALLLIAAAAYGLTSTVNASGFGGFDMFGRGWGQNLTAAQQADIKAKNDAVTAAVNAGDYNAWVAAIKAINPDSPLLNTVTAGNFQTYVINHKARAQKVADQKAKADAVTAALKAGDYNAWVTAVKAVNPNSQILTKITSSNFSQYAQAYQLKAQADSILSGLGLGNNGREGFGMMGFGFVGGRGGHRGGMGGFGMMGGF